MLCKFVSGNGSFFSIEDDCTTKKHNSYRNHFMRESKSTNEQYFLCRIGFIPNSKGKCDVFYIISLFSVILTTGEAEHSQGKMLAMFPLNL